MRSEFTVEFAGEKYPSFYVDNKAKAEQIIKQLASKSTILAADTETMALPAYKGISTAALSPHLGCPRLIQMFTGTGAVVIDLLKTGPIDLKQIFRNRPSVFHNMTFDYKMLSKHYGIKNPDMHCTCIMARCVFHAMNPGNLSASLGDVAKALFKEQVIKKAGKSDWSILELTFEQIEYAAKDAILQMKIYEKLNGYIDQLKLRSVYDVYRKAQLVICEMELNGIGFNVEAHKKNIVKWREELMDAKSEVLGITGLHVLTDSKIGEWLCEKLPPEILEIWPKTAKGDKLSTDANTLVDFGHMDFVKPFARFQKLKKLTTSFGINLIEQVNPATKRLHPGYRVAGAKTGRLSCSEPNIQQMPRDKSMREVFVPTKGYEMVVADYSQVEVRCIAELSNDPKMLEAFAKGLDIYSFTVAHINTKHIDEVSKAERQAGKALVLGLSYGLGHKKFSHYAKKSYGVEINPSESYQLIEDYRKLYAGLRAWQLNQVEQCPANRYTSFSALGKSRKMTDEDYYGACMNHPVQGSCAEIMLLALVYASQMLKDTSFRFLACVHDEIVGECLPHEVEHVKKILTEAMVKAYTVILPSGRTLKNLVEPTSGFNWAEAKEDKPKKPVKHEMKVLKETGVTLIEDMF